MRKQLLLAVLMVAAFAVPSFASVQNIKISGDVDSTYLYRHNFDLGAGIPGGGSASNGSDRLQNNFFTQTRLRADADLSDNVSATVGLINERVWDYDTTDEGIDINLAFCFLNTNEIEKSIFYFEKVVELDPENLMANSMLKRFKNL